VLDEVLGRDPGHKLITLVELLPPVESESVDERMSEVIGGRWGELWFVGHGQIVAVSLERIKNMCRRQRRSEFNPADAPGSSTGSNSFSPAMHVDPLPAINHLLSRGDSALSHIALG
jgi:hypothetical protein